MIEIIFGIFWLALSKGLEDGKWGCMWAILLFIALLPLLGSCMKG